jgi:hypothetical protein
LHILEYPELQNETLATAKETLGSRLWREKIGRAKFFLVKKYGINRVVEVMLNTKKMT